jgi:hypothetical protein
LDCWLGKSPNEGLALHGAIHEDEKLTLDLAGPGYKINQSNLQVLESKADMQKREQRRRLGPRSWRSGQDVKPFDREHGG